MSKISKERKITYYIGMGMVVLGFILFVSFFFSFVESMKTFEPPAFLNAVIGMILMIAGALVSNIGVRGAAGSGLILDP